MKVDLLPEEMSIYFDGGLFGKTGGLKGRIFNRFEFNLRKCKLSEERLSLIIKKFIKKTLLLDKISNYNSSFDLYLTLSLSKRYHPQVRNLKEKGISYIPEVEEINLGKNTTVEDVYNAFIRGKENFLNKAKREAKEYIKRIRVSATFTRGRSRYFEPLYPLMEISFAYSLSFSEHLPDLDNSVPTS